ncbi:MAG TPA: PQQ-dependent sugar dehydrogenase [Acidimicrobiales bacterium]|nr:PQQ-dependent sugar dehydrogenase [Acidimicrobiales bacterium]
MTLCLIALAGCDLPDGFHDYVVFSDLSRPTAIEFSPDGRIFVAEKRGVVKVFDGITDRTPTVVADLRTNVYNSWDRGLLGLALHPDFPATPEIFVSYTYDAEPGGTAPRWGQPGADADTCPTPPGPTDGGCVVGARVSRLRLHKQDGVMTGGEHVLVEDWCQQYPSHSIGTLVFGADGALYAGGGEGASFDWADYGQGGSPPNPCGDPGAGPDGVMRPPTAEGGALRSLDLLTPGDPAGLGGTIIRIDPRTGDALPDNPLAGATDPNARRIVAQGMRNPFRFTVRPGTSELWVGDVGWRTWEEINVTRGDDGQVDNFGWPCFEGAARTRAYDLLDLDMCEDLYAEGGVTAPRYQFQHGRQVAGERCPTDRGSSITGLAFTPPGSPYPGEYDGSLFFADSSRRCIFVMLAGGDGLPDPGRVTWFHHNAGTPVELETGPGGELWYVDLLAGTIHRIGYSASNAPPQAAFSASPTAGDPPLTVTFDASASGDTDPGDVLRYAWDLDGDGELDDGDGRTATATYDSVGTRTVRLAVTDAAGATDTAEATIWVGTAPAVPTIATPAEGTTAAVGATVPFSGGAAEPGGGDLPPSALSWSVDMMHCMSVDACHRHPDVATFDGVASGSFVMPDHEYPAYVELRLVATWEGETVTATRRVDYRTVDVTLAADTGGVALTLAGETAPAPFARPLPEGSTVTVSAPEAVTNASGTFAFASWSDGGARTHEIVVPAAAPTLTAHYVPG